MGQRGQTLLMFCKWPTTGWTGLLYSTPGDRLWAASVAKDVSEQGPTLQFSLVLCGDGRLLVLGCGRRVGSTSALPQGGLRVLLERPLQFPGTWSVVPKRSQQSLSMWGRGSERKPRPSSVFTWTVSSEGACIGASSSQPWKTRAGPAAALIVLVWKSRSGGSGRRLERSLRSPSCKAQVAFCLFDKHLLGTYWTLGTGSVHWCTRSVFLTTPGGRYYSWPLFCA